MGMINWEDYNLTKRKMPHVRVEHIDGIGFEADKFKLTDSDRTAKRLELGVHEEDILILSVGELQKRKNQEVIIRAIAKLNNPNLKYILCGRGELLESLQKLCRDLHLSKQVQFLGHRYDIKDILKAADIFAHPSLR